MNEKPVDQPPSWRIRIFRFYDTVVDLVILSIIPLMLVALGFAFVQAFIGMVHLFPQWHDESIASLSFRELVDKILDVVILIELFSAFMDYARTHRIHISTLIDMTIVFTLREVLVLLYGQNFLPMDLLALCVVIIVLVIARSITLKFSPRKPPPP